MDMFVSNSRRKKRAWIDLMFIGLASLFTWFVAGSMDLAERWINWAALGEHFQLDEIIFVLLVACFGLMWFGKRRFGELESALSQNLQIQLTLEKKHHEISLLLEQNRSLIKHITFLRESERNQLASELHDVFGQYLAAIDVNASIGLQKTDQSDPLFKTLMTIQESTAFLRNVTRSKLRSIKPPGLDKVGVKASIEELVEQSFAAFPDQQMETDITINDALVNYDTALTLYRCLQEGLVNISRHANATMIKLKIWMDATTAPHERICMQLTDDGKGFHDDDFIGKGMGLIGIRERVNALHGEFSLKSESDKGTQITISLPLETETIY